MAVWPAKSDLLELSFARHGAIVQNCCICANNAENTALDAVRGCESDTVA